MEKQLIRVLHVEDDPMDAVSMHQMLREAEMNGSRYLVTHVDNMKSALKHVQEDEFDAILLDLKLKDVSGLSNISSIQMVNPNVPVVVISGLDNDATILEAIDTGAQDYLVKGYVDSKNVQRAIHASVKRKVAERDLYRQANFDVLTGLPNRRLLRTYVDQALKYGRRHECKQAMLFIDLDDFKQVNDSYGHEVGDKVLVEVSKRLKGALRDSDVVCRYAGDEFVILSSDHQGDEYKAGALLAQKVIDAMSAPFHYADRNITLAVSVGIAMCPDNAIDYRTLILKADKAMYEAKKCPGSKYCFSGANINDDGQPQLVTH